MNRSEILAIPVTEPERLFGHPRDIESLYRQLAKKWHPDHGGDADVFTHLHLLRVAAKARAAKGMWERPGEFRFTHAGKEYLIHHKKKHALEIGDMYICNSSVAFDIKPDCADLFDVAALRIGRYKFASDNMQKEISRYLPKKDKVVGRRVLTVDKSGDLILLRDLRDHMGVIPPAHLAWIISSLLNLACYFQFVGLTHNAISLDTYFVSPKDHNGVLLGGWWYSADVDAKLTALPSAVQAVCPKDILTSKRADPRLDLNLIRSVGRDLSDKNTPRAMQRFFQYSSAGNAKDDYRVWSKVLDDSFGKRRFVELKVSPSDIYKGA